MDRGIGAAIWDRIGDPVKRIVFNGYIAKVRLASPRIRIDAVGIKYEPSDGRPRTIRKRSVQRNAPRQHRFPLFRTRKGNGPGKRNIFRVSSRLQRNGISVCRCVDRFLYRKIRGLRPAADKHDLGCLFGIHGSRGDQPGVHPRRFSRGLPVCIIVFAGKRSVRACRKIGIHAISQLQGNNQASVAAQRRKRRHAAFRLRPIRA